MAALQDIDTLVLLTPPDARQVDWAVRTIDLAQAAGVSRVVRMSVLAAAMEPGIALGRWHRTVERYLSASDMDWTIVRPGPFMQNFLGMYPASNEGFRLPVGDAAVNHIHVADVARALATVTLEEGHSKHIYMLTGGQPLSLAEAAKVLSQGKKNIGYDQVSLAQARKEFIASGRPEWFVEILLELFGAFNTGAVGLKTSTFEDLTGQAPMPFADFAREAA
jgi:uncharacterized protein YbjT (DUF2867 family)